MNRLRVDLRNLRAVSLIASVVLLGGVGGCGQRHLQPLGGAPDGDAEVLSLVSEGDGEPEYETSRGTFRDLVKQPGRVVLVEFWGPHCGPCLHMIPILERIVEKHQDTVTVVKVNLELASNQELGRYFEVHAIPEIRFFVDGETAGAVHGYVNATQLTKELQPALAMLDIPEASSTAGSTTAENSLAENSTSAQ